MADEKNNPSAKTKSRLLSHRESRDHRMLHPHRLISQRRHGREALTEAEMKHLADVITEVEKTTSGELRLILVRQSVTTGHVFPLLAFILSTLCFAVIWHWRHFISLGPTDWLSPVLLIGSVAVAFLGSRMRFIERALTLPLDRMHQVHQRAELEFNREGLGSTKDKTGILIFLSVMEKQAVVLADRGIAEKLDPNVWNEVVKIVIDGAREGTLAEHLEQGLRRCGELLVRHFPIQPDDVNELPNHVLIKD